MSGSGGGLIPGDRVHLGRFPANTVVSWFLVANGWTGNGVGDGNGIHYSQPELNKETDPNLKTHTVLLHDAARNLNILAFEDIPRDWSGCDEDFNDAVFYAQVNPVSAIQTTSVAKIDTSNDSDGDGINDELDNFPFDPNIAFNNFYPSVNTNGTLAYEDLWPSKGDYDFNDLVIDYQFNLLANSANKITRIEADFEIKNIGGAFHNGFAIVLPIAPSNIESVQNQLLNASYLTVAANGTEAGMEANESVIFIVGDAYEQEGNTIAITINLNTPMEKSELGSVPFNPFLVVNGDRAKEVHLPDFEPTSKALYLGEKDDFSSVQDERYYKTEKNLPWALNIYSNFIPSPERIPITITYPRFVPWANSGGATAQNWYIE